MSEHRIEPERIKTIDSGPKAKGGQGTVVIGTIIPPEGILTWIPKQLFEQILNLGYAIKKLEWDRKDAEESIKFFKVSSNHSYIGLEAF